MATADSGDVLPHLRTEAIRAVVGPTSADRGFAVAASGAVGRLRYDAATGRLSASVQGTAPSPYRVQVQLQEAYDDAAEDGALGAYLFVDDDAALARAPTRVRRVDTTMPHAAEGSMLPRATPATLRT